MTAQTAGNVGEDRVTVVEFDGEGRARENLFDAPGNLQRRFLEVLRFRAALLLRASSWSWSASCYEMLLTCKTCLVLQPPFLPEGPTRPLRARVLLEQLPQRLREEGAVAKLGRRRRDRRNPDLALPRDRRAQQPVGRQRVAGHRAEEQLGPKGVRPAELGTREVLSLCVPTPRRPDRGDRRPRPDLAHS
jgi:hypothetical protein